MATKTNGAMPKVQGKIKDPVIPGTVDRAGLAHKFMSHGGAKAGKGGKC